MIKNALKATFGRHSVTRIQQMTDYLLFDLPLIRADLGLVFGMGCASGIVAKDAINRFEADQVKQFIVSGGVIPAQDKLMPIMKPYLEADEIALPLESENEADYMKRIMVDAGVPENIITVETTSQNTGQNVENSLALGLQNANTVIAISLAYHQRRILGTLRKHIADATITTIPVYPVGITKDNWSKTWIGRYIMNDEADKIGPSLNGKSPSYISKGFAAEVNLDHERERLTAYLNSKKETKLEQHHP